MKLDHLATVTESSVTVKCPLEARFAVAGSIWAVSTNAEHILAAMRETFLPASDQISKADLSATFYVDFELPGGPRWPQPHFRALDHLYYATYGPGDSLLVDQLHRRIVGLFSPAMASDLAYWKRIILPVLTGIASACVGITPLHCACVVRNGLGLLLSGESGAGKSTLALALSLNGFAYLSDDCTYISRSGPGLRGWGLPTPVKLLPDAVRHFSQLLNLEPGISLNGELSFEVDPVETFGVSRRLSCAPHWLVFVERTRKPGAVFERISAGEAASRFASDLELLPPCISSQREYQLATIEALVKRECWLLRHGMTPSSIAQELAEFCNP
jgi:hypothetical protein